MVLTRGPAGCKDFRFRIDDDQQTFNEMENHSESTTDVSDVKLKA